MPPNYKLGLVKFPYYKLTFLLSASLSIHASFASYLYALFLYYNHDYHDAANKNSSGLGTITHISIAHIGSDWTLHRYDKYWLQFTKSPARFPLAFYHLGKLIITKKNRPWTEHPNVPGNPIYMISTIIYSSCYLLRLHLSRQSQVSRPSTKRALIVPGTSSRTPPS